MGRKAGPIKYTKVFRITPDDDAKIDDMIVDVQAAIERFHEAVVHEFAIGDPNRFTLVGHSSGAHVTALALMKHSEKLKIQTQLLESRGGRMSQKENNLI